MHKVLEALRARGWTVETRSRGADLLPPSLARRYPSLPAELVAFLSELEVCHNAPENAWLLTAVDYAREDGEGFAWNEYERMALAASEDEKTAAEVRAFWDHHFPFALAVHSDYDYLAVCLTEASFGTVVHGFAPEWEHPSLVSPSFAEFLGTLQAAADSANPRYPYALFL